MPSFASLGDALLPWAPSGKTALAGLDSRNAEGLWTGVPRVPWGWRSLTAFFRRGASGPALIPKASEQTAASTPKRTESNKPIAFTRLEQFIFQPISVNADHQKYGKEDYIAHLADRQINRGHPSSFSRLFVFVFGTSLVWPFMAVLGISVMFGGAFSCSNNFWSLGCQAQISQEFTTPIIRDKSGALVKVPKSMVAKEIRLEPINRETFNFVVFEASLVALAFALGFVRWQFGNRQDALNSVFDRKKELNLLFLDSEKKLLLEPLIRGATDPDEMIKAKQKQLVTERQAVEILDKCQSIIELGSNNFIDIGKKVFVFMELDNLEYAYEKYMSGYLDAEQMHRACEILESRCLNKEFRYLAVTQGLVYYNPSFHCIIAACIVRGYLLAGGEIPASAVTT